MAVDDFLKPTRFVDSDAPAIVEFSKRIVAGAGDDLDKAQRLFLAVRDSIRYNPYIDFSDPANYTASRVLKSGHGFCVGKAALLSACARSVGLPARMGYADVYNHMTSPRMRDLTETDIFIWHSYTELWLGGRWIKATPAFNIALCERVGVAPLEFDGRTDALFQAFDKDGRRHMEYLKYRGEFADVPFSTITAEFRQTYPRLMAATGFRGDFESEAIPE
jgi:transglutaminase-like putative cysteine protease